MAEEALHGRKSLRLRGHDYATPGAYFVTICAYQREMLFENAQLASILYQEWAALPDRFASLRLDSFVVMPNHIHFVVWLSVGVPLAGTPAPGTPSHFTDASGIPVRAGASPAPTLGDPREHGFSVGVPLAGTPTPGTPSHFTDASGVPDRAGASPAPPLGDVVGAYKSLAANKWLNWVKTNDPRRRARIWQRNYYDRVIRNEAELTRIREYIAANPMFWQYDHENPARNAEPAYDEAWSWLEQP